MKDGITDKLRHIIIKHPESRYRICKETGINESVLCRFLQGRDIEGRNIDKLAEYLGLELVEKKERGKK